MSKRGLNRLDVLARLDSGRLTVLAAAGLMNVTLRQTANQRRGRRPPLEQPVVRRSAGSGDRSGPPALSRLRTDIGGREVKGES